jgi:predicted polyphosphate/ATP-dependent NAD kinase
MTYGYNSKLTAYCVDTIMDYGRTLMEQLKLVRKSADVSRTFALRSVKKIKCLSLNGYQPTSLKQDPFSSSPTVLAE